MTDFNDLYSNTPRRSVLRLAGTALAIGSAGCFGDDSGLADNSPSNENNTSTGNESSEQDGENTDDGGEQTADAADPVEMTLEERMNATHPTDVTPRNRSSGNVPAGIADAYNQIYAEISEDEPDLFVSPNYFAESNQGGPIIVEGVDANELVLYRWDLPSGDEAYSFHRTRPTHPDGPYSDLSDVVRGSEIVDEQVRDDFEMALGNMTALTLLEMGEYAPNQVEDSEPYVIGADHIIYDQESDAALAVDMYGDAFETLAGFKKMTEEDLDEYETDTIVNRAWEYTLDNMEGTRYNGEFGET